MTVGIVGLGLIGGSFAKAYHEAGHRVLAFDTDQSVFDFAVLSGAVDGLLSEESLSSCDLILIAVYPSAAVDYLRQHGAHIGPKPVVIDCCGTKRLVCDACFPLAKEYGFTYLGGHPMAGTHNSGFKYATSTMFHNAPMVLVPADHNDIDLLSRVKELLAPAGFGRFSITTAEQHDEMIAFTSQLAHITSSAYVKSPEAQKRRGFSAGSFRDMTRVARLDEDMWTELFLDDEDFLTAELEELIGHLTDYRNALRAKDTQRLHDLLKEGRELKATAGGN